MTPVQADLMGDYSALANSWRRMVFIALASAWLITPAAAQSDFELRANYCLGSRQVLDTALANDALDNIDCARLPKTQVESCNIIRELKAQRVARMRRLKLYVMIRSANKPQNAVGDLLALRQGQADARALTAGSWANSCAYCAAPKTSAENLDRCYDTCLQRISPATATIRRKIETCKQLIEALPF